MFIAFRTLRHAAFRQQLIVTVTAGVLVFALLSSSLISWQGGRQIRESLLEQGQHVAENLASQSVLALLYASEENAREVLATTLAFPDVGRVEILLPDGETLVARGDAPTDGAPPALNAAARATYLEAETDKEWRFVTPVVAKRGDSELDGMEQKDELLGFVRVAQSKTTLLRLQIRVFAINLTISLLFAAVLLLVLRHLANHLTQPITALSQVMARAERGELDVRAGVGGPRDIVDMAAAFNSMIGALGDRERALRESQESYRDVVNSVKSVIFQTNPAGEWVFLNNSWAELTGTAVADALGRPMTDFLLEEDRPLAQDRSRYLERRELTDCRFEARYRRPDGSIGWFDVTQRVRLDAAAGYAGTAGTLDDITEQKRAEEKIAFLAYHDALTKLPNRLLAQDRFDQAKAQAGRTGGKVALVFLDLDNFKTINDSLGHLTGDALLQTVAQRLTECVRAMDTVCRLGGDEFLLILPALADSDAMAPVLVKLLGRLVDAFQIDDQELNTSASIGISLYPDDGADFEVLLKKSDIAMYRAKEAGRNTYRFFDDQMNLDAVENLRMRNGLRRAVERNEFLLHYQPQIDLASGAMVGVEALVRWNHPGMGMVPPGRFIPIAEDSGLIVPIGEWVLLEACRQAAAWAKAGIPGLTMAVNLSGVQFRHGDIEQSVIRVLEVSGIDPALLELELTESILIRDTEKVLATVQRLKQLGIKLSIDDFGTGYSSLSYLKRFQVDKLKIDRSFLHDLVPDTEGAAIVRAIIQMARGLGLTTIAEGVETERTVALLRDYGCDEVQGYYFARPMPAEDLPAFRSTLRTQPQLACKGEDLSVA